MFGFKGDISFRNLPSSCVDCLRLIGLSMFCIAFADDVCEYSCMVSYGVFGALPCIAFAATVAILAVYGLVCISLHVGLWIFPLMAACMWADGCIRVGCMLATFF